MTNYENELMSAYYRKSRLAQSARKSGLISAAARHESECQVIYNLLKERTKSTQEIVAELN